MLCSYSFRLDGGLAQPRADEGEEERLVGLFAHHDAEVVDFAQAQGYGCRGVGDKLAAEE